MNEFQKGLQKHLSKDQIALIQSFKIGIGGCGGLGSNLATILVRCGFENFEILDRDVIDASNLNRQSYFLSDIGSPKTNTLKRHLLEINPKADITTHQTLWSDKNADQLFKDCDVVAEAFDQAKDKRNFVEFYQKRNKYVVSASGLAGFSIIEKLKIKKMGNIYLVGDQRTEVSNQAPPLAPGVIATSALMAETIVNLVLKN